MITKQTVRLAAVVLALVVLPFARTSPALAAAPTNDNFANATVIEALAFMDALNTSEAGREEDDPYTRCGLYDTHTVWYAFTPSVDTYVDANTFESDYDTVLAVYTGSAGDLTEVACNDQADDPNSWSSDQSQVLVHLSAGTTYYFMVAAYDPSWQFGGNLVFNVSEVPFTVTLNPGATGSWSGKTGVATVGINFSCTQDGTVNIQGTLTQVTKKGTITGSFQITNLICEGTGAMNGWNATVVPTSGKFVRGDASLSVTADGTSSFFPWTHSASTATTVKLGR